MASSVDTRASSVCQARPPNVPARTQRRLRDAAALVEPPVIDEPPVGELLNVPAGNRLASPRWTGRLRRARLGLAVVKGLVELHARGSGLLRVPRRAVRHPRGTVRA